MLTVSSKIQVPFWPVPMTMQTFVVLIIAMAYGWKLSFFTLVAYLIEGALGLPVFAKGGGTSLLDWTNCRLFIWDDNSSRCNWIFC